MLLNAVVIIIILLILIKQYFLDYDKGLRTAVFFLILAPLNLTLEINDTLPSLTIHRFIILIMYIAWIRNAETSKRVRGIPFGGLIILITITTGISVLLSDNFLVSIKRYLYYVFESVVFFFIIVNSIKDDEILITLMKTVALSLAVVALLSVIEKYTGYNPTILLGVKHSTEFERMNIYSDGGVVATYSHRILLGVAMVIGAIYSLFLIDKSENRAERVLFWTSAFLTLSALYFSTSRGPWLAFCVASIVLLFIQKSIRKRYLIIFVLIVLVFIIRPGTLATINELYVETFQKEHIKGASYEWRYIVLKMAYTKVIEARSTLNILFGFGQGSHLFLNFPRIELATGHYAEFYSWDNEFAVTLLEHGFVGITVFLCFYLLFIKRCLLHVFRRNKYSEYLIIAMASVIVIMFMKTNVKIFAPQLLYLEFLNVAVVSAILSNHILENDRFVLQLWINPSTEEITK